MKAVIMAGGFGTRLRPLTCNIPKPMVPMVNRPMMLHIVDLLKKHGFSDIISLLFYHPNVIRNFFGEGKEFGINMHYTHAEADFGTAGSVRNASDKIGKDRVLIISGDVLTDFDLGEAIRFHEEKGADATIVLTRVPNPLQFGVVIVDDEGNITRFLEKPSWGEVFSDTINTGIYILENSVLEMIPYKEDYDFSKNLFPLMMQEGKKLCGYISEGYWRDVGNLGEYHEASMDCLTGAVDVVIDGTKEGEVYVGEGSTVPVERPHWSGRVVIGRNARVADSAKLINSVIGDNVTIHDGAVILNSVIWDGCTLEQSVQISNSVVGFDSILHAGATVADNVFISDRCSIGKDASLLSNIKLWPEKVVQEGAVLTKSLVWEDKWLRELFADARITGTSNIEINPEFGAKLGACLGAVLGVGSQVLASRDPDNASRMIKRAIACGLMSSGVNVHDMQTTAIPMLRQVLRSGKYMAGFHVRKSPFDKRSMDIIFFDADGQDLSSKRTKAIERQFFSEDFQRADYDTIGSLYFPERTTEAYRERFLSTLNHELVSSKSFNIVIDYSYGIASSIFPNILGKLGAEVISLNAYIDRTRLTRSREEFSAACQHVSGIVRSLSNVLGILLDAGAEKVFLADETGNFLDEDRVATVITKLFLEARRLQEHPVRKMACPIVASAEMDVLAEEYGVTLVRTPNTHGGMMNAVLADPELDFVAGTRGGFIFPEFLFATDAMYSVAKILEMMAITGWRIGEVDRSLLRLCRASRTINCPWQAKGRVMRFAMNASEQHERQLIDGIKILFARHTWVLLVPSKEHEVFMVYTEATTQEEADRLASEYEEKVVQWRDNA
ncbi:MAG: NTP transferase domain-containing protein [Bacteroidetes bacterium]|nr:NTP transferase domain-containing protein [Bacteroidota bacterium]